ncbi:MAG: hypothetical protein MUC63_04925 [Planctomycetes bacterium]|jgi:hypothetical protein|nr:hypothetical protein [Planctomycetota bacterium]
MKCAHCGIEIPEGAPEAAIAIFVLGDEVIYSYRPCPACRWTLVRGLHDHFMGDTQAFDVATVPPDVGARCVELVRKCPNPQSKYCECDSHKALYYGLPR